MMKNYEKDSEKNLWSNSGERAGKLVSKAAQKKLRKLFLPLAAGLMLLFSALLLSSCDRRRRSPQRVRRERVKARRTM